jgi:hypothetical protein
LNKLVKDWGDYCEGKADFDKSHFSSMFTYDLNDQELNDIFKYFSCRNDLIECLKTVITAGSFEGSPYLQAINRCSESELLEFVILDLKDKQLICVEQDAEVSDILSRIGVEFVHDRKMISQLSGEDNPSEWIFEIIGDLVDEARGTDRKILALEEACYGLAANYYLAWFIMSPLLKLSIDFSNYFKVWSNGGIFVITEDKVLVSNV